MLRILLFVCLVIGLVFMSIPNDATGRVGFLFVDFTVRVQEYVYFMSDHVVKIILAYIIMSEVQRHKLALKTFLFIQVADTIDYICDFNTAWFTTFAGYQVTFNIVACIIFTFVILYEYGGIDR